MKGIPDNIVGAFLDKVGITATATRTSVYFRTNWRLRFVQINLCIVYGLLPKLNIKFVNISVLRAVV